MEYQLPAIPYLKVRFVLKAQERCRLPQQKGSMLRGAFGHALRSTVCVMRPDQPCKSCLLRRQCVYTRLFDVFIEGEPPPFLKGVSEAPKPFIIDSMDERPLLEQDEHLEFTVTLLGLACELTPYVVFAVSKMAGSGLGAERHPFFCESAWEEGVDGSTENERLYRGDTQCLCRTPLARFQVDDQPITTPVRLSFVTPTRLKFENHYSMEFTFRMLAFKLLRRVLELAHFHVPDAEVNWDFNAFLKQADAVSIRDKKLEWEDRRRYSNRQKTDMEMGGFVGEMTLDGAVEPFSELLRTSEMVFVGKGTSFGLGKMRIQSSDRLG
jgi:hypothetical protein